MPSELRFKKGLTPLGHLLIASESEALVYAEFAETPEELLEKFQHQFSGRESSESDDPFLQRAWAAYCDYLTMPEALEAIPVTLNGTAFQRQVWEALEQMPLGSQNTYGALAEAIGQPSATRAVASACASNTIALRIPCHRILRSDGALGGFRWGLAMKRRLLSSERRLRHNLQASDAATN